MKIAICDDNKLELDKIMVLVTEFIKTKTSAHELTVKAFPSGRELLLHVQKHGGFDLYLLDIIMPEYNGIVLAQKIREYNDSCKIIFLTSSPEFAVESYKVGAFYYLLKNSTNNDVCSVLDKALKEMQQEKTSSIMVKEKGKWTCVSLKDILYVESINHTVYFNLHQSETVSCFNTLNTYEDVLLSDKRFVKCHKSYIVNMRFVTSITNKDFILTCGYTVPISRNVFQKVKDMYFDYFFEVNI